MKRIVTLFFVGAITVSPVLPACKPKALHYEPAYANDTKEKRVFLFGVPSQAYYELTDSIVKYLNDRLHGIRVQAVGTSSYSKYNQQLAQGYYDLTIVSGITAVDVISHGYSIVAKELDETGNSASIVVNKDSSINSFPDLKGKTVATPGAPALPGHMLQILYLTDEGINVKRDLKFRYFESFESVFLNVYLGKCAVGFSNTMAWKAFIRRRPEIASKVVEKWQIPGVAGSALLFRKDMDQRIAAQLRDLFLSMDSDEEGRMALSKMSYLRFEPADSNDYVPLKQIVHQYNSVTTDD